MTTDRHILGLVALQLGLCPALAQEGAGPARTIRGISAIVHYSGIDEQYANAALAICENGSRAAQRLFGITLPRPLTVSIALTESDDARVEAKGSERVVLVLRSAAALRPPAAGGEHHVYRLCSEIARVGFHSATKKRDVLTSDALKAWAYYAGSLLTDAVYEQLGPDAWPEPYDYAATSGVRRLRENLSKPLDSDVDRFARTFLLFGDLAGTSAYGSFLSRAGTQRLPLDESIDRLAGTIAMAFAQQLTPVVKPMVRPPFRSDYRPKTAEVARLGTRALVVRHDDGVSDGEWHPDGRGFGVRFRRPPGEWYLSSVRILGRRMERWNPRNHSFKMFVCDQDRRIIQSFSQPCRLFESGATSKWVSIALAPMSVPETFHVWFVFRGVGRSIWLAHDEQGSLRHSMRGLPDQAVEAGQAWMVRVALKTPGGGAEKVVMEQEATPSNGMAIQLASNTTMVERGMGLSAQLRIRNIGKTPLLIAGSACTVVLRMRHASSGNAETLERKWGEGILLLDTGQSIVRVSDLSPLVAKLDEGRYLLEAELVATEARVSARTVPGRPAPLWCGRAASGSASIRLIEDLNEYVAVLIAQLSTDDEFEAEQCMSELEAVGMPAARQLKEVLGSGDPQVDRRARKLLERLGIDPDGNVRLWASRATASSQYGDPPWSAMQATGKPNTMQAGDSQTAWATRASSGGVEWLELTYAAVLAPSKIRIRETFNPGAVSKVEIKAQDGAYHTVWEGHDPTRACPAYFTVAIEDPVPATNTVKIWLDTRRVQGWNEIDAVELIGKPPE